MSAAGLNDTTCRYSYVDVSGDLRALALVEAVVREDGEAINALTSGPIEADELAAVVRCLALALATTLELNLGQEGALAQVEVWRRDFMAVSHE